MKPQRVPLELDKACGRAGAYPGSLSRIQVTSSHGSIIADNKDVLLSPPPTPHLDDTLLSFPVDTTFGRHHLLIPCRRHIWTTPTSRTPVDTISSYPCRHHICTTPSFVPLSTPHRTTPTSHPQATPPMGQHHLLTRPRSAPCQDRFWLHHFF